MVTEHLVINLQTLGSDVRKLRRIIDTYEKYYKNSEIIVYDTDLKYIKKEITVFLKNLKKEINKNIEKNPIDIFEREYLGISKYIYAELVFSKDYTKISSVRLLGRRNRKTKITPRFMVFNLDNPYDPAILNIISNIKKITKVDLKKIKKNPDFLKFFKTIKPLPLIKNNKNTKKLSIDQIKNLSAKFDLKTFKSLEEFRAETNKIESLDFKTQIYDSRTEGMISLDSVTRLISDAENIIERIENSLDHEPLAALSDIYSELLTKYNLSKVISDLSLPLLNDINPLEILRELPVEELLKIVESLPEEIRDRIQNIINSKININKLLSGIDNQITNLIEPCNFIVLKDTNPDLNINDIFKSLRLKYPKNKFPEIENIINQEFKKSIDIDEVFRLIEPNLSLDSKQLIAKIPDFNLPEIEIPNLSITDLFGDISSALDDAILSGISVALGKISVNVLESVLKFPTLELPIDDILKQLPDNVELPNLQFPNINNLNYPNINVNFDIKKIFKNLQTGELNNFEVLFNDKWSEFLKATEDVIKEAQNFSEEYSSASKIQPEIEKIVDSLGGVEQIKKEQILENKKCKDIEITPPDFNEQNLDLEQIASNIANIKEQSTKEQLLNQIKNYRYSNIHSFLINKKPNKKIITVLRKLAESDSKEKSNRNLSSNKIDISKSLVKMMEEISSLLTPTELLNLFAGDYTYKTANIVRNVAKLNHPDISSTIDPVKFYLILGKISGLNNFKDQVDKFRNLGGKK